MVFFFLLLVRLHLHDQSSSSDEVGGLLLLLVRLHLHDQSSSSDEVGVLLQVLQARI